MRESRRGHGNLGVSRYNDLGLGYVPISRTVNGPMRLLDLTLPDPAENLALDEALLLAAEEGGAEVLAALGIAIARGRARLRRVGRDRRERAACEADRVPILRRASGGGTVLLGPGCLCFSLVLSYDRAPGLDQIRASNQYVLDRVAHALAPIAAANLEGTSDLAVNGVKISGNAQQRKRTHFLHHGTLLCGFDLALIAKYLHAPERQPDYRRTARTRSSSRTCPRRSRRQSGCSSRNGRRKATTSRCRWRR